MTTIQVGRDTAERLKHLFPNMPYDEAIQSMLSKSPQATQNQSGPTETVNFSQLVAASMMVSEDRRVEWSGKITAVYFHFPPGPLNLVEVRLLLLHENSPTPIFPKGESQFIALDNITMQASDLIIPVERGDTIRAEWWNYDTTFAHTIPIEVTVAKVG